MSSRSRWPYRYFAAYCAVALLALTWPAAPWWSARVEHAILGLPFSLAWIVAWIAATLIALVALEWCVHRRS